MREEKVSKTVSFVDSFSHFIQATRPYLFLCFFGSMARRGQATSP